MRYLWGVEIGFDRFMNTPKVLFTSDNIENKIYGFLAQSKLDYVLKNARNYLAINFWITNSSEKLMISRLVSQDRNVDG